MATKDEMKMKSSSSSSMKSRNQSRLVLKHAITSRLLLLSLILLWRSLLSPYDTSASINPACLSSSSDSPNSNPQVLFPRVAAALEDSIVWDSVYFVRIAQCGYEYEQSYAFFPLLPICISLLSRTGQFFKISFSCCFSLGPRTCFLAQLIEFIYWA